MDNFLNFPDTDNVGDSHSPIIGNFLTLLSSSSASAFPTTNLYIGRPCWRTDLENGALYFISAIVEGDATWTKVFSVDGGIAEGTDLSAVSDSLNTHVADTNNPHAVTADQLGAATRDYALSLAVAL